MPITVEFGAPKANYDDIASNLDAPTAQRKKTKNDAQPSFNFGRMYTYTSGNEGVKNKVYKDSEGIPTVGMGFNLTRHDARAIIEDVGADYDSIMSGEAELTDAQTRFIADQNMRGAVEDARALVPSFNDLSESRQIALADMAFNMGRERLGGFKKMLAAIEQDDWVTAGNEVKNSQYAQQVGDRAGRNIDLFADNGTSSVAQSSAPPAPVMDYDAIASQLDTDVAKQVRTAVQDTNPDEMAEADALSALTGLPTSVVESDLPAARAVAKKLAQEKALDASPKTAEMMTDPQFARVAHADIGSLAETEALVQEELTPARANLPSNLARGIGERAFDVVGGLTSFVGTVADSSADFLEKHVPLGVIEYDFTGTGPLVSWRPSTEEDLLEPSPLEAFADDFRNVDLNYQPGTTWDDVKDRPLANFLPFALEQGIVSAPDMAAVMINLPGYVVARTGEIGTNRAGADGRAVATVDDFVKAAPAAIGSAVLERLGTRGILGVGDVAREGVSQVAVAAGKAGAKEAATEFGQEVMESTAETLGTTEGFDLSATLERGLAGAVGGFGFGTTVRAGTATIEQVANTSKARDNKAAMDRIQEVIEQNPMTKRDPAKVAQHFEHSMPGEKAVYIPIGALDEMAEGQGVAPGQIYTDLGVAEQVEEAHLTGGDVVVTGAAWAEQVLAKPEVYAILGDHYRKAPDDLTNAEANLEEAGFVAAAAAQAQAVQAEQEARAADPGVPLVETPEGPIADRRAVSREGSVAANQATFRAEAARAAGDEQVAQRWAKIGQRIGQGDVELAQLVEAHDAAEGTAALRLEDQIEEILTADEAVLDAQERVLEAAAPTNPDLEPASADVSLARQELGLENLFRTADEAGMTPRQYETYLVAVAQAAEGTKKRQEQALLKKRKAANDEKIADEREVVAEEMRENVQAQAVYAALNGIGQDRLSRSAVVDALPDGEAQLETLPKIKNRSIYTNKKEKGGVHPDAHAEQYGFADGQVMLFSMIDAVPEAVAIEQATDAEMERRHPELLEENRQIEEAIINLHTDQQAAVLAAEMNALREARGAGRLSVQLIRSEARRRIGDKQIKDVRVDRLLAAEKREGRTAGKLLRQGDRDGAGQAKFRQLMNYEMAKAAMKTVSEVSRKRKYLTSFLKKGRKFPTVDADYVDSVKELLGMYDLGPKLSEGKRKNLTEWFEKATADGALLKMPERLWRADNQKNWQDMTIDEFDALYAGVKNIEAQGKLKKKLVTVGEEVDFQDRKTELLNAAEALPDTGRVKRARESLAKTRTDKLIGVLATADAGIRRVEFLMKLLDNFKTTGIWQETIFQPFARAQAAQSDLMKSIARPIVKSLSALPKETRRQLGKTMMVPSLSRRMTRAQLLMVALNAGNDSNLIKMVRGSEMDNGAVPWTEDGVLEALQLLTPDEARWVQGVWDAYGSLQPEVERIYRAENGVSPTKITPREINIGGEVVKGGYFPMMYRRETAVPLAESAIQAMQQDHVRESVYSGMTVERTGFVAPVVLDLDAMPRGLQQNIHYITHYEAVRDVNRVVRDPQVKTAIRSKLGDEYYESIDNWVKAVATAGATEHKTKGWDDMFTFFRSNVTAAVMGLSWTTGVAQTFGLSTSVAVLGQKEGGGFSSVEGTKWMGVGLTKYAAHPVESTRLANKLSSEMRHRIANTDREITEALGRMGAATGKSKIRSMLEWQQRTTLLTVAGIQLYTVDVPTWIGAYNQGLSQGRTEADAAQHADSVLRLSQASGATKDLSALQRRRDIWRALTMFATYAVTLYNLQAESAGAGKRSAKNLAGVVGRFGWLAVLPAIADAYMREQFPDDDDEKDVETFLALKILGYSMGSIPVVGRGVESALAGFDPTLSPVEQLPKNIISALAKIQEAWEDGEMNSDAARAAAAPTRSTVFGKRLKPATTPPFIST
jgi:GH24 family phage-related lysozyme (muramidase)